MGKIFGGRNAAASASLTAELLVPAPPLTDAQLKRVGAKRRGERSERLGPPPALQRHVRAARDAGVAFALLQSLVAPALLDDPARPAHDDDGGAWILTAYLLSASVRRRSPAGSATCSARSARSSPCSSSLALGTLLSALATSIGVMIAGRVDPGRGRRRLPALVRDHPRRVPAREGRRRHRADLRDPRHRRRRSGSSSPGRSSASATTGSSGFRSSPSSSRCSATLFSSRSRRSGRPARIDWLGAVLLSAWLVALLVGSARRRWGWGSPRVLGLFAAACCLLVWVRVESRTRSRSSTCT